MATTYSNITSTAVMTNLLVTVYDKYFEWALRSEPVFRSAVDKRPVNVTNPGESVVFNKYANFAQATSTLTEAVDPDKVAMTNTSTVTVTLNEYGNAALETLRLKEDALSDVDTALANGLAYNCMDSLDALVQTQMATSVQKAVRAGGTYGLNTYDGGVSGAPNINTIAAVDVIKSNDIRSIVATLRTNNVVPRVNGGSYVGFIHPYVSADLQSETGAAAFRDPHVYNSAGVQNIWNGVVGQYQGVTFVESSRLTNAQTGSGAGGTQYRTFDNYFLGAQALAEAVNVEATIKPGPVIDVFSRFLPIGWYFFGGWKIFRPEAILKYQCGSAFRPQA